MVSSPNFGGTASGRDVPGHSRHLGRFFALMTSFVGRHRNIDAAVDVLGPAFRTGHDVECEYVGRQPQAWRKRWGYRPRPRCGLAPAPFPRWRRPGRANSRTWSDIRWRSGKPADRRCERRDSAACPVRRPRCLRRSDSRCSSARSATACGFLIPYLAMPPLITSTFRCSQPAISMAPQKVISPSPWLKCRSPIERPPPFT